MTDLSLAITALSKNAVGTSMYSEYLSYILHLYVKLRGFEIRAPDLAYGTKTHSRRKSASNLGYQRI